jgi:hypothetical protein
MPIYHVKTPSAEHIVDAGNQYAAINHVVRETITAKCLTASDLLYLMQDKGLKVETAKIAAAESAAETVVSNSVDGNQEA